MAHRPLILATASLTTYLGETAFRLCENYADAIVRAGGLPVVLPLTERIDVYDEYLDRADGLMLTGGADIEPAAIEARSSDVGRSVIRGTAGRRNDSPTRRRGTPPLIRRRAARAADSRHMSRRADYEHRSRGAHSTMTSMRSTHLPLALAIVHNEYMDGRISHTVE